MIENKKPEMVEEDESSVESERKFFKVGFIIIGTIPVLMIACIVTICILENI